MTTTNELNRRPDGEFEELDVDEVHQIDQLVPAGETYTVDSSSGMTVSGPVVVDGVLEVNGSFTDTVGPITGTGTIKGSGTIKVT